MNPMSDGEFVSKNGNNCPYCDSEDLYYGEFEADGKTASQENSCKSCESQWWTIYELVGYEGIGL